ncbi:MAG TPA: alpha-2-macroglobulin family protein [Verrucomicrobiae bacterium]|nr:alpha-2-macroglobulin family protein [Verrucomicrobiae bacterium]
MTRPELWRQVTEAEKKGLPQTAIKCIEPIIQGALKDKAYGEAAHAIARRIVLEGTIQGNKPEEKIRLIAAEVAKAPAEIRPLLQTIEALWYWHYFQENRWRFMERTRTGEAPGADFTTWDLPRIFKEIDRHFAAALADVKTLRRTPITDFGDFLVVGTVPDAYRPTLYDFIAQEALAFYTAGEQAAAKPEDAFEIPAESPILTPPETFLAWQPQTADVASPALKAIRLYQELLRFHSGDGDRSAFLDADLARLTWGHNVAVGEGKAARYQVALSAFAERNAAHELSAMALHRWAVALQSEGNLAEAHRIAARGRAAFPDSAGGKRCQNLIADIEAKSAQITTERVWACPDTKIAIAYRNVTKVWFRAVEQEWVPAEADRNRLDDAARARLMGAKPALEWSADLPPTPDFKERVEESPVPHGLEPGYYVIIASHNPRFGEQDNQLSVATIWVSDIALVTRERGGRREAFVLDAVSGEPVAGANVRVWRLERGTRFVEEPTLSTDENGLCGFAYREGQVYSMLASRGQQRVSSGSQHLWRAGESSPVPTFRTTLFTDRALYRPGQTIHYKGIVLLIDQTNNRYETVAGRALTVVFSDPNGKEIARARAKTNDYGSFSGNFTAPRDRLAGRMTIAVTDGAKGATSLNVEEYKRPRFEVTLDAPKVPAKLGEKAVVAGKAMNYTGAPVDGATLKWRVVREVIWPPWWGWFRIIWPPGRGEQQEIAHGEAKTGADGAFAIEFIARPDPKVSEKDQAHFRFHVFADVTDPAGETRSADRAIHVGFAAMKAALGADPWEIDDKAVELRVTTTSLDDEPMAAKGMVRIHRLKEPERVPRAALDRPHRPWGQTQKPDPSDPNTWALDDVAIERPFATDAKGKAALSFELKVGLYRAVLEGEDAFGKKVTAQLPLHVLRPSAEKLLAKVPQLLEAPKWTVEPGGEFVALWGTGYDTGRAFVEIEHRGKVVERYWTGLGRTQQQIRHAVTEAMRGGFQLHVTQVRENRAYLASKKINVPWSNKVLGVRWDHFTSKLQPGQKETWTLVVSGPGKGGGADGPSEGERAVAEIVAGLYDESLDQFLPHDWPGRFDEFYSDQSLLSSAFANTLQALWHVAGNWERAQVAVDWRYRGFPPAVAQHLWGFRFPRRAMMHAARGGGGAPMMEEVAAPVPAPPAVGAVAMKMEAEAAPAQAPAQGAPRPAPKLDEVTARKNLDETAFFFPHLMSGQNGEVRITFTMPEALTRWRFMAFAHDRACRSGYLEDHAVTAKDLMVQPNPPRFMREGDELEFTVKVTNRIAEPQRGKVRLSFRDARTEESADAALGNAAPEIAFDIPANESRSYGWRIRVPDGCGFLAYKAVGATDKVSDGEEGFLPVLPRRILVTESLPLPIRGPATKQFHFEKLLASGKSDTLRHENLTLQMVSNPSWYAVMALPYLMEFPHECSEQVFNRLYANALARHIANSDPRIRRIFDQWKGTAALDSPLEKNQDLKAVMLEETPWLRQAKREGEARKNVGVLFDANHLDAELGRATQKLAEAQLGDGSWPWFPGGRGNDYITLYITTGFGRLRHLGAEVDVGPALRSLERLDRWMAERHREILKGKEAEKYVLSSIDALYLYGRSFFLKERPINDACRPAADFYLGQGRKLWLDLACRQSQGHLALALDRFGGDANREAARAIMASLKERSVNSEEMGMFWRETELSWWWYRAPIETQALMIEAFDEVAGDATAVEDCRVWLLKQKQTQDWKTTKATADAVYALLLRGKDILASSKLVEVSIGDTTVTPGTPAEGAPAIEPGTGFYERRFGPGEIRPGMGEVTVKKVDEGVAWGSLHWQYLEDMSKVTPHEGTPLKLKKALFTKRYTPQGPALEPVRGPVLVGDELVVRIELRVDRDMEYVHLKDHRGSGTEPVNVLSGYRYQDGLAYYESTRDTASHFFIDYLPKGTYVFEYSTRIQLRGRYPTGVASIQCMYAPEFNSHSESIPIEVK